MNDFGLSEKTLLTIRDILKKNHRIEKAIIYGSRAKGNYKQGSDIDLTFIGSDLTQQDILSLSSDLDDSDIPYTVDVSLFDHLTHAKLQEHIERVGVLFYEREEFECDGNGWENKQLSDICHVLDSKANQKWEMVELGKIVQILDNKRKPITKSHRKSGEFPYYGATGIVDYVDDYIFDERLVLIGEDGAKWNAGDKTAFIAEAKYWVNNHVHVVRPIKDKLIDIYLVAYLNSIDLSPFITGATVPKLNQEKLRSIKIPLPPLAIQKKIVEKLDAIFTEIDKIRVATETNIKNAEQLLHSYLNEVFKSGGEGWEIFTIKDLIKIRAGDFLPFKNMNHEGKIDVYGGNGISGKHNLHNISGENIIIGRVGAYCGNVRFVIDDVWITDNAFYVSEYKKNINKEFLAMALENKNLRKLANQMAQPVISFTTIKDTELKIPISLDKQIEILQVQHCIETQVKIVQNANKKKINQLNLLKQSILKQAFSGKLVN